MNPQLGDSTEVPVFLCLCRFHLASEQNNVGLELSLSECKHPMDIRISLLLSTYSTAVYLESSPCSHLYNMSKIAALSRFVLKCHQMPHNARVTSLALHGCSLSIIDHTRITTGFACPGPDRLWLLWCAPSWLKASLMLYKDVKALV